MALTGSNGGSDTSINNMLVATAKRAEDLMTGTNGRSCWTPTTAVLAPPTLDRMILHHPAGPAATASSARTRATASWEMDAQLVTPHYRKRVVADVHVASIFSEPSAHLQRVLRDKAVTHPAPEQMSSSKKQRLIEACYEPLGRRNDLLHRACCLPNTSVDIIQQLLQADPGAASRALSMPRSMEEPRKDHESTHHVTEPFTYPLNLAIHHRASSEVLALLIHAAPNVLDRPDGPRRETSLHIIVRTLPQDSPTLLLMLLSGSNSAMDCDGNYPLHLAYQYRAAQLSIEYLELVHPDVYDATNRLGQRPIDLVPADTH